MLRARAVVKRFLKYQTILTSCLILVMHSLTVKAQGSLSIRATPSIMSKPLIENPFPEILKANNKMGFDGGIEYHYLIKNWDIGIGVGMGLTGWDYKLNAPSTFFGTKADVGQIKDRGLLADYVYNSVILYAGRSFTFKDVHLRAYAGPSLRKYYRGNEIRGFDVGYNTAAQKFNYDPAPGNEDISVVVSAANRRTQFNFSSGISVEKPLSKSSIVVIGIRKNWGLRPIGDGKLYMRINNEKYYGTYSPRSNFLGLDVAFKYRFPQRAGYSRDSISKPKFTNSRKAFYLELLGNSPAASINFDRRINLEKNNGLGYRIGIGTGSSDFHSVAFPLAVNYLFGSGRNALETGAGITPRIAVKKQDYESVVNVEGFFNLGYRFQPLRDGLIFRAMWTPVIYKEGINPIWIGASIGYMFK